MDSTHISVVRNTLEDYTSWVDGNKPRHFSLFNYLFHQITQRNVEPDFIVAFFAFLWPEFREIDGKVILAEEFSQEAYDAKTVMNTFPVSKMFRHFDFKTQKIFGDMIAEMWGAKLKLDFPGTEFLVECYEDEPEDLWCHFFQAKKT